MVSPFNDPITSTPWLRVVVAVRPMNCFELDTMKPEMRPQQGAETLIAAIALERAARVQDEYRNLLFGWPTGVVAKFLALTVRALVVGGFEPGTDCCWPIKRQPTRGFIRY